MLNFVNVGPLNSSFYILFSGIKNAFQPSCRTVLSMIDNGSSCFSTCARRSVKLRKLFPAGLAKGWRVRVSQLTDCQLFFDSWGWQIVGTDSFLGFRLLIHPIGGYQTCSEPILEDFFLNYHASLSNEGHVSVRVCCVRNDLKVCVTLSRLLYDAQFFSLTIYKFGKCMISSVQILYNKYNN